MELSLGGAESAVVWMSRALCRLGHRVTVACKSDRPREVAGVAFIPEERLLSGAEPCPRDLLISCRYFLDALELDLPARVKGLWLHDPPEEPLVRELRNVLPRISLAMFLSRFHRDEYLKVLPELEPVSRVTRNGVELRAIDEVIKAGPRADTAPLRFIFGSRPIRGLEFLLSDIWPRIRERYCDAELLVTSYDIGDLLAGDPVRSEWARKHQERYDQLIAASPGARNVGPLTRRQFWLETAGCRAVLYPTQTPEVSCLVALEAQALGVPIVTTDAFALRETVGFSEGLVSAPWQSQEYRDSFVEKVRLLVEDRSYYERARRVGKQHLRRGGYSWDQIAASWTDLFHDALERAGARPRYEKENGDECA